MKNVVVGLNLCPFAKKPMIQGSIHYYLEETDDVGVLAWRLLQQAQWLLEQDEEAVSTMLIVHPNVLSDFLDYNDFLGMAEDLIVENELEGEIQLASFHPDYRFAGTKPNDVENYTNRSPYPMLHLIREAVLQDALEHYPDPELIPLRNIEKMKELGEEGIKKLLRNDTN